jgi:hypothetical protein
MKGFVLAVGRSGGFRGGAVLSIRGWLGFFGGFSGFGRTGALTPVRDPWSLSPSPDGERGAANAVSGGGEGAAIYSSCFSSGLSDFPGRYAALLNASSSYGSPLAISRSNPWSSRSIFSK